MKIFGQCQNYQNSTYKWPYQLYKKSCNEEESRTFNNKSTIIAMLKVYKPSYQNDEHEILFILIIKSKFSDHFFKSVLFPYFESSFKWQTFLFLMLVCSNLAYFSEMQFVCDGRTDRRTDGRTDRRTDTPSYRDARTHLKTR